VQADGTLVNVQQRPGAAAKTPARAVSWVLDASALIKPMQALVIEWRPGPVPKSFARVSRQAMT